jgi:predicted nucleotidyltransferase
MKFGMSTNLDMLNDDYKEILQLLIEAKVDFLLIGAYAVAAHGYPRSTGDIDIWINPTPENAKKTYDTIVKFGAPLFDLQVEDLYKIGNVFQIGIAPRRIDILTGISGVIYSEAKEDFIELELYGMTLPFISLEKLIRNKEATGRDKDKIDLNNLKKRL